MGPCGPSTEIHIDLAEGGGPLKPATLRVNAGSGDLVELWNLVFIQFNRDAGGNLSSLPNKHVDTGMGLERLTAVLQNVKSNYDTDLFSPLLSALQKSARVAPYRGLVGPDASVDVAYRIVVDHARMFTVAISDGVLPEHFDAGNKLRRVIRKASHAAIKHLKCDQGVLASLADSVYTVLGEFYPNLDLELVKNIVNLEEDRYLSQMSKAEAALHDAKPSKEISATHCLNMALRAVLGSTEQRSSLVDSRHLRFDFLSKKGLTTDQVQRVQDCCNAMIRENHDVQRVILPKSEALELPQLVTVANEEYPTSVSVITIGKNDNIVSRELCCGTHVSSLSDLGEFVLTSHRSVGSMVRSVCAVAGPLAVNVNSRDQHVAEQIQLLAQEIAALMKLPPDDYVSMASCREKLHEIRRFIADNTVSLLLQRTAEEKLEKLKRQIDSIIRKYNHTFGEQRVLDELNTAVKQWEGEPFQVVCLRQCTDGTLVTKLARKLGQHKPSFIAVRTSPERLQVDCYVPEEFLSETFQACTWAAVAERYGFSYSYSSSNHSEPEMYYRVIICCEDNSMEELESVAVEFAKAQLSGSVASRT
ncbi:alanyl-tRNA synthetase, putative [Ixodes scapularis]|uniref:alanine--tRNA ligase n=1 Tax=Ixodes scapularis TaxID=6945 RepID=B7Q6U3_IXOSC|nr:alanyl-tRNA synthetase, putative [Ixodes scapularis]|eukprot:XP_002403411.1 alanyl-tRNA synthetase, putative [Ixodes scapularis]